MEKKTYREQSDDLDTAEWEELSRVRVEVAKSQGSYTLELTCPIKSSGAEVKALTFRAPRVRDLKAAGEPGTDEWQLKMIAACTEVPSSDLEQLDPGDYEACGAVIVGFKRRRAAR